MGSQATYKFATKGACNLNIKDQISSQGIYHSMYGKMQASGLTELTSFQMHLSCLGADPVSLFTLRSGRWLLPEFPQFLSNHRRVWQHLLNCSFESPHNIWRPEIIDGCHIYCLLIWQEIFLFHIPHFLYPFICQGTFSLIQCLGYGNSASVNFGASVSF